MNLQTILEVAKKNWVSIALGVVMLIALIAIPTFISGQQAALQKKLAERKDVYDKLNGLMGKTRHQPVVSLDPDQTPPSLPAFPNQMTIEAGRASIERVQKQSLALKDMAANMNVHRLLLPGSLPGPGDPFRFKQAYLQQFQKAIPARLQSATPPSDEEIKIRAESETARITGEAAKDKATGEIYNKDVLQQNIAAMLARLPEDMKHEAATKHKMYMAPTALSIQPELVDQPGMNTVPDIEKIWLAQVGLWIQQDVVDAIAKLNSASNAVADSPVKQLLQIYVAPDKETVYVLPTSGGAPAAPAMGGPGAAPASIVAATTDTEPFPRDYAVSPTGRVCNGVFDVVNFMVVLHVQASDVEKVIAEFERNRLLTVYQTDIQAVNSAAKQQEGFYFGKKNGIVTLTMKCEELLMRDWSHKLMPPTIKRFLNVDQGPEQPQQPAGEPQVSAN
jgi:hypothetical protein